MACNPCLCMSLRMGAMIMGLMDMVFYGLVFILVVAGNIMIADDYEGDKQNFILTMAVALVIIALQFFLGFSLFRVAKYNKPYLSRRWLFSAVVFFVLYVINIIVGFSSSSSDGEDIMTGVLVVFIIIACYKVYQIIVAYMFRRQLLEDSKRHVRINPA